MLNCCDHDETLRLPLSFELIDLIDAFLTVRGFRASVFTVRACLHVQRVSSLLLFHSGNVQFYSTHTHTYHHPHPVYIYMYVQYIYIYICVSMYTYFLQCSLSNNTYRSRRNSTMHYFVSFSTWTTNILMKRSSKESSNVLHRTTQKPFLGGNRANNQRQGDDLAIQNKLFYI